MATDKYDLHTIDYSVQGWDSILQTDMEKLDEVIPSREIVVVGETVATYDFLCFSNSDNKWYKAKADGTLQPAHGISLATAATNDSIRIQRMGTILNTAWSWATLGVPVYLHGSTAGSCTLVKPASNVQIVGYALASDSMLVEIEYGSLGLEGETGTGALVRAVSPVLTTPRFVTPTLGAAASGTLDNCVSNTEADNNSSTQLATTKFVKKEIGVLVRKPDQAVNLTYAASGSSGITVANNDNINSGIGNFTQVWRGRIPDWTPGGIASFFLSKIQDGNNQVTFWIESDAKFQYYHSKTGGVTVFEKGIVAISKPDGTEVEIAMVVTRESVSVAGSVNFYIDGVLHDTLVIDAGIPADISNTGSLYILGTASLRNSGACSFAAHYNRALSAAEVLDLYRNGVAWADKWGSQISLNLAAMVNNGTYSYPVFSGASITGFHAESDGSAVHAANTTDAILYEAGLKYRIFFNLAKTSGSFPSFQPAIDEAGTLLSGAATQTAVEGVNSYEFIAGETTTGLILWYNSSTSATYTVSDFSIVQIGAVLDLEPEGINEIDWQDASSNGLDATYPTSGSSLTRQVRSIGLASPEPIGETLADTIRGKNKEIFVTASASLSTQDCCGTIISNYGMTDADCLIELPAAQAGLAFVAILPAVQARYVRFQTKQAETDKIYLLGVAGTDDGYVGVASGYATGAAASFFCFKASDGGYDWYVVPIFGTWVAG